MAESDLSGKFVFGQKWPKMAQVTTLLEIFEIFFFHFYCELRHFKQEKAIKFFENFFDSFFDSLLTLREKIEKIGKTDFLDSSSSLSHLIALQMV